MGEVEPLRFTLIALRAFFFLTKHGEKDALGGPLDEYNIERICLVSHFCLPVVFASRYLHVLL